MVYVNKLLHYVTIRRADWHAQMIDLEKTKMWWLPKFKYWKSFFFVSMIKFSEIFCLFLQVTKTHAIFGLERQNFGQLSSTFIEFNGSDETNGT